jgi:RNA 2',3'-cyclic 3'-phosphodiesterase
MGEKVGRLFVGVAISDEVREELGEYLRSTFGERVPGRAVALAQWHLTLRFLGDTDAEQHRRIVEGLRAIPGSPFDLSFGGLGAFPRAARASVLWVGVEDGARELRALAAGAEEAARRAGFAAEEKPYSPHLTISRVNPPRDLRNEIQAAPAFGGRMRVDSFILYRSHLGGGPARYERMEVFPLG